MEEIQFKSKLKDDINKYLEYYISLGYKGNHLKIILKKFDRFCLKKFPTNKKITKELTEEWCIKDENEANPTFCDRIIAVRKLATFINDILEKDAYIIPENFERRNTNRRDKYVFTEEELRKIFKIIDSKDFPVRKEYQEQTYKVLPVLFRVLLCCGLRIGEALDLTVKDVDLERGILNVKTGKTINARRKVPMSLELTLICKKYSEESHKNSSADDPFFYNLQHDRPYPYPTIADTFDLILEKANIYKGEPYSRATIHSLRHTLIILRIREWSRENKDFSIYQLVLLRYLGHKSFSETLYYFKLTQMLYPDIQEKYEKYVNDIFPNAEIFEDRKIENGGEE